MQNILVRLVMMLLRPLLRRGVQGVMRGGKGRAGRRGGRGRRW